MDEYRLERMKAAVRTLLKSVGEDVEREGLADTPKRVVKALIDASSGYHQTPRSVLGDALFNESIVKDSGTSIVCVRDIEFASTSSETLLPFHGRCHIGYVPSNGVVLGLSKFSRLTKMLAKRLQTQSRLGDQIAASLQHHLGCHGVAVIIEAKHLCMGAAALPGQETTVSVCGCFAEEGSGHLEELLAMLGLDASTLSVHALSAGELHASVEAAMGRSASLRGPATPDLSGSEQGSDKSWAESCDDGCEGSSLTCSTASEWDDATCCGGMCSAAAPTDPSKAGAEQWRADSPAPCCAPTTPAPTPAPLPQLEQQQPQSAEGASLLEAHEAAATSIEHAMRVLLRGMLDGRDPDDMGLGGAPTSYAASLLAATSGYTAPIPTIAQCAGRGCCSCACQPAARSTTTQGTSVPARAPVSFAAPEASMRRAGGVTVARVAFTSQCEHHMLPFYGTVDVAWEEGGAGDGDNDDDAATLAAMSGVVGAYTRRLQVQERITQQVAEGAAQVLGVEHESGRAGGGLVVVVDAAHMCMVARGVENHAGRTTTVATRGVGVRADPALRTRLLQACRAHAGC